jgi:hypothetical protein
MPITKSDAKNALAALVSSIHKSLRTSFWYRVYDSSHDDPKGVQIPNTDSDERREAIERKKRFRDLYQMSFCLETGLSEDEYNTLLVIAGLLKKNIKSGEYMVQYQEWKHLNSELRIDVEIEAANVLQSILGNKRRWYIRIGQKNAEYNQNARGKIEANKLVPPGIQNIRAERRNLKRVFSNFNDERVEEDDGFANFNDETVESTTVRGELFHKKRKDQWLLLRYCCHLVSTMLNYLMNRYMF